MIKRAGQSNYAIVLYWIVVLVRKINVPIVTFSWILLYITTKGKTYVDNHKIINNIEKAEKDEKVEQIYNIEN